MEKMSDENTEEVKVLESEIERLQAEVESLQHQQQEINKDITFHYSQQMENALWVFIFVLHFAKSVYSFTS